MWPFKTSHLPFAKGSHIPGCVDIMTEYSKNGLFFRLYYPTNEKGPIQSYSKHWLPWIPHDSYVHGLARVLMTWVVLIRVIFWFFSGKLYIPALYGAKIKNDKKLKCIILSHGLGGGRYLYSSICVELASRGFLVAVIEHRDESAGSTYYYKSAEDLHNDKKTYINYIPVKLGPNHHSVRSKQVKQRAEECTKLLNLLISINKGDNISNILQDLPTEQNNFNLKDLEDKIDVDDVSMMGHSFGAATALLTISNNKQTIRRGIILDPWMFPIKDMPEISEISHPLIFINTQTFHITSNITVMEKFMENMEHKRSFYTILHTTHENQTDSVFAGGYWLNWFMKKLSPENATDINNSLILRFMNKEMNIESNVTDCEKYLLQQSENYVEGIDALKTLITIRHKSIFKIFNS